LLVQNIPSGLSVDFKHGIQHFAHRAASYLHRWERDMPLNGLSEDHSRAPPEPSCEGVLAPTRLEGEILNGNIVAAESRARSA
jgi:hypothetical protein